MPTDRHVRELAAMARKVARHYEISLWMTRKPGERPLPYEGFRQESCRRCGSGGYIISCGSDWRCLACFRMVPGPVLGPQKRSY
jgi:hypothetical protein